MMKMKRAWLVDVAWGLALAALTLGIILLGTSGPKFIYIDF